MNMRTKRKTVDIRNISIQQLPVTERMFEWFEQEMSAASDGLPGLGDQLETTQITAAAHLMGLLQPSADRVRDHWITFWPYFMNLFIHEL